MLEIDLEDALAELGILEQTLPELLSRDFAGPAVVEAYAALNREYFDSAGGGSWPALEESTQEFKRRTGLPLAPLVRSGRLRAAVTDPFGSGAGDVDLVMEGDEITWSLRGPPYARYMHTDLGGSQARPLFDVGDEVDDRIAEAIDEFLESRE